MVSIGHGENNSTTRRCSINGPRSKDSATSWPKLSRVGPELGPSSVPILVDFGPDLTGSRPNLAHRSESAQNLFASGRLWGKMDDVGRYRLELGKISGCSAPPCQPVPVARNLAASRDMLAKFWPRLAAGIWPICLGVLGTRRRGRRQGAS